MKIEADRVKLRKLTCKKLALNFADKIESLYQKADHCPRISSRVTIAAPFAIGYFFSRSNCPMSEEIIACLNCGLFRIRFCPQHSLTSTAPWTSQQANVMPTFAFIFRMQAQGFPKISSLNGCANFERDFHENDFSTFRDRQQRKDLQSTLRFSVTVSPSSPVAEITLAN
jgi:hypothetical protein